ncbi:hypothetical protein V2I01_38605 [Micromonospora sp. BRA006-A]|nr:hypothetical protein [Micromonospora sp. BRA006-A]
MDRVEALIKSGEQRLAADAIREARAIPGYHRHPRLRRASRAAGRNLRRTGLAGVWVRQELSDVMLTRGTFDVSDSGRLFAFPANVDEVEVFDLETLEKASR